MKRFKKRADSGGEDLSTNDINLDVTNASNAKEIFRKMQITTSYSKNFGDKPKNAQDFQILKEKQFSKLAIAQVLKPHIRDMINRWLAVND